jgi:hypothetical protein
MQRCALRHLRGKLALENRLLARDAQRCHRIGLVKPVQLFLGVVTARRA